MTMLSEGEKKRGDLDIRPLTKAGHYGNLDIAQAKELSAFKRVLTKQKFLPDPAMVDEEHQDTILLRFLRARDWNVQHAYKMYSDTIKWRKEVDLSSMMQGSFDFEERDKVAAAGWKMYFHGTDKFHRPIFVQDLAALNTTEVFTHTTPERVINFFACMLEDAVQRRYRACTTVARDHARDVGFEEERVRRLCVDDNFMILNVAGIGMGTFWAFKGQLQKLLGILDTNFPELSGRVQIINAPWLFSTIWSYIKGWLPVNTAEKIDIVGTDFKGKLLEFIDEEQLPTSIGGTCQCGGKGCEFSDVGPWQEAAASRTAAAAAAAAAAASAGLPTTTATPETSSMPASSSSAANLQSNGGGGISTLPSVDSSVVSSEKAASTPATAQSSIDATAPLSSTAPAATTATTATNVEDSKALPLNHAAEPSTDKVEDVEAAPQPSADAHQKEDAASSSA